ncbi:MAG TPA: TonB-dependent receptor [Candidatus Acidoferrum sp.]|nr:TonB-dependent receptor [Candidatus Acidoferrum sp.]
MSFFKLSFRALLFLACASIFAVCANAQFKASIQGTVMDPKGGVVAGAKITVTNPDTGIVYEAVASGVGYYRVSELPPGNYTVTVEAPGFKKFISQGVAVQAEQPRGMDVTLDVGAVSEQVTVTASQQVLQTEDPNISTTISSDQIERLPQVGRDPYELLKLAPGVFGDGARTADGLATNLPNSGGPGGSNSSIFLLENQVQATANGQRNSANNFMVDGTSVNSLTWGGAAVVTPNQESVQDITIVANSYSAEDGRNSGAQIKVVSKSGTNQFHGSGFFKDNSPGFNAFARWGGPDGQKPEKDMTNLRQFGGSIGGPVLKEKLFFFFSYEGDRTSSTNFSGAQYVETPALAQWITTNRAGTVIGGLLAAKGSAPRISQVLPATCNDMASVGLPAPTNCAEVAGGLDIGSAQNSQTNCTLTYGQYQNIFGDGGNTIPASSFNGCGLDGVADIEKVILEAPTSSSGNQYNARVDYNLTKSDLIAVSFYITPITSLGGDLGADGRPMADLTFNPRNRYIALIWNRTISPTMTNEARMNFTRLTVNQFTSNSSTAWNLPRFEIEDMPLSRIIFGANTGTNSPAILAQNQYIYSDVLSKIFGRHAMKFGVSAGFNQDNNDYEFGAARPDYVAHGLWNFVNGTPIFQSINVDPRTGAPTDVHKFYRQHDVGLFIQDDFKARPNLTLSIGLRYDYLAPLNEKFGRQANLIPGTGPDPLATASLRIGEQLYPADKNNFAPRLGFAWSPSKYLSKTVIRGGFGVAYNRIADTVSAITRVNPPFLFRENLCCAMSAQDFAANPWGQGPFFPTPAGNLIQVSGGQSNNPLSWPANPAIAATFDPTTGLPLNGTVEVWGASQNLRTPYTYLYSLDAQRELPANFILDIGYQGSQSRKLERIVGLNRVYSNTGVLNPAYLLSGDVNGNFNALNVSATRRYTHGFQFAGKYQFSRGFDGGSWEGSGQARDPFYPASQEWDYGPSDFVVTHNVLLSALYDLPVFKNRHDFVGKAFGGWRVDGTYQFHTGFPWSPVESNNCPPTPSAGALCPALVASYLGGATGDFSTDTFKSNHGQFPGIVTQASGGVCPAPGQPFGAGDIGFPYFDGCTAGPPFLHRNAFRGPRYQTIDASFAKSTPVPFFRGESANLDLRVNFFNLFNKLNLQPFGKNDGSTSLNDPHFGVAQRVLAGRVMELQARLTF